MFDSNCVGQTCGVIKQNEPEFANIDLEIEPKKGNKSFSIILKTLQKLLTLE